MNSYRIGIIGGTGLYQIDDLKSVETFSLSTPFGSPSSRLTGGELHGTPVVFLSRHGEEHRLIPSEINYRANIYALKSLGVEQIIGVSAVGSMRENIHPRELVIPEQFFDRTRTRHSTFFGDGIAAHVSFADPVCPVLCGLLSSSCEVLNIPFHKGGTYLCIEGPHFSTRAESTVYRSWGMNVIGMSNLTEAKLAREAEICFATLAFVTDYDCWHETEEAVSTESVLMLLKSCIERVKKVITHVIPAIPRERDVCVCASALRGAIITPRDRISTETRSRLGVIIDRHLT
jgi:5'-methylthioadenosine phosphorylase